MFQTYRHAHREVTALQWAGDNAPEMRVFANSAFDHHPGGVGEDPDSLGSIFTDRHSRWELLTTGDWVTKTNGGHLERLTDADFRATYEPA